MDEKINVGMKAYEDAADESGCFERLEKKVKCPRSYNDDDELK